MSDRSRSMPDDEARIETGLQLASRLMALVKSGRAYAIGHTAFNQQLENYLRLLEPVLAVQDSVRLDAPEGDVCLDGERLPYRPHMQKSLEQLAQEFGARAILGVEFSRGLTLAELVTFMRYFLPSERWKGAELLSACADARLLHVRPLPVRTRVREQGEQAARLELPEALGPAREAWGAVLVNAQTLLAGDGLDHGVELRHLARALHPVIDAVLAGEPVTAALGHIRVREPLWAHAAHTALLAVSLGAQLGLPRAALARLGVAALLHDAGHGWGAGSDPARHGREGLRRLAWATTFNRTSLAVMRTAFEHHGEPLDGAGSDLPLASQIVTVADTYTTLLAHGHDSGDAQSPSSALARTLVVARTRCHPALSPALVRALGVHPPGQVVELDDGTLARVVASAPDSPERPSVEFVADAHGTVLPIAHRRAEPLPGERRVLRALPRADWPAGSTRDAA